MEFPRNNKKLDQIFLSGSLPEIQELEGEYLVDMLTLPASRRLFPDSKIFYSEDGKPAGHNRLFKTRTWGKFFLEECTLTEPFGGPCLIINYDTPRNTFLTRPIRDHIKRVKENIYLGRFNLLLGKKLLFLGYFSLSKRGEGLNQTTDLSPQTTADV